MSQGKLFTKQFGILLCLVLCLILETNDRDLDLTKSTRAGYNTTDQGFHLLPDDDIYPRRQERKTNMAESGEPDMMGDPYPTHNDFMKQLINYLEFVGKK